MKNTLITVLILVFSLTTSPVSAANPPITPKPVDSQPDYILEKLAHWGMSDAQFQMGQYSFDQQHYRAAIDWYRQSLSNKKYKKESEYNIGVSYFNLSTKTKDSLEAHDLLKKSAQYHFPYAIFKLGQDYFDHEQYQASIDCFLKIMSNTDLKDSARYNISAAYWNRAVDAKNNEEALMFLEKSAQYGNKKAVKQLNNNNMTGA